MSFFGLFKDKPEIDYIWKCELCGAKQVNVYAPKWICGPCMEDGMVWAAKKAAEEKKALNA